MKQFTIKNLQEDAACEEGLAFVTPLIEKGEDVAVALRQYPEWLMWAIQKGYDCHSAWIDNVFTWSKEGYITATAGDFGKATAGNYGVATAGDFGTATAGNEGMATAGDFGTVTAGNEGTATAGDMGAATSGDFGTAIAGYGGAATAGDYGTVTAGNEGTATAGNHGVATAGENGIIKIKHWDKKADRNRIVVGYIGEDGLEPNTPYKLDREGKFVKA